MLRNLFIIGLLVGFVYTVFEVRHSFAELQYQRVAQIEQAIGELTC